MKWEQARIVWRGWLSLWPESNMWSNIQELFNPESILFNSRMNLLQIHPWNHLARNYLFLKLFFKVVHRFSFWAVYKFNNFTFNFTCLIVFAFIGDVIGDVRRDQSLKIKWYLVWTQIFCREALPGHVADTNSQIDLEMIRVFAFQIPFSYFWQFEALLLYL